MTSAGGSLKTRFAFHADSKAADSICSSRSAEDAQAVVRGSPIQVVVRDSKQH